MREGRVSHFPLRESGTDLLEENYFDALWRPVISHRKDTSSGKERFVVKSYDVDGHTLFESYPLDALTSYSGEFTGTNTLRDALGRPYQIQQSSELGTLTTSMAYLTGFQTKRPPTRAARPPPSRTRPSTSPATARR